MDILPSPAPTSEPGSNGTTVGSASMTKVGMCCHVRGHVQMTSVRRGGGGVSKFLTIRGGGCVISILTILTGGGGVKNPENYADVICTWPHKSHNAC